MCAKNFKIFFHVEVMFHFKVYQDIFANVILKILIHDTLKVANTLANIKLKILLMTKQSPKSRPSDIRARNKDMMVTFQTLNQ